MSKLLDLKEQMETLKNETIAIEIAGVPLSRFKKVSLNIADSIYPLVNPHDRKVLVLAAEVTRSTDAVTGFIERFNETQKVNVAAYNKAKTNPDLWSDNPTVSLAAQEVASRLNMLVIPTLPSEIVNEIAAEREHRVKVTTELAVEIRLRDDWNDASNNIAEYDKGFTVPSLSDSMELMAKFTNGKAAGEYPITDVVESTGLTFSQVKELVTHMANDPSKLYGVTSLEHTHVLVL